MRLSFPGIVETFNPTITGILHLGDPSITEAREYAVFTDNVVWIESNPRLVTRFDQMVARYGQQVIHALLSDRDGVDKPFRDLLLKSSRLDTLAREHGWSDLNFLKICADTTALKGAHRYLTYVDYVFAADLDTTRYLDDVLDDYMRVDMANHGNQCDAFWVRRERRY